MRVVTAEMIRALDRRAMDEGGIPGVVLMENAGRAVFEFLLLEYGPARGRAFRVLCGTGNNGGDGYVAARYLELAGADVSVTLVGHPDRIREDAATHFRILQSVGVRPRFDFVPGGVKIDALLGTGISGAPRDEVADAIRRINADPQPTVAVDIPSGVDSDTGATPGEAVRAEATVTFGYPKLGLLLSPGADFAGTIHVDKIGFDWDSLNPETPFRWLRGEEMAGLLSPRKAESYKGMYGHVLVVGGSRGMSGAPTMTARAAMRAGAGLVTVAAPASAQAFIAGKLDEAMTVALPEKDGALDEDAFRAIHEIADKCDVLCVGPGATQKPKAQSVLLRLLREIDKPLVLDADGLNALAGLPEALQTRTQPAILTPHPGECARLLDSTTAEVQADRVGAVREAARRYRAVVVLKGARTLISDGRAAVAPDQMPVSINTTSNPGMATGGSGDTLTGIIGAFLGQHLEPYDAACYGVYIHGRAGNIAAEAVGETGMVAGDIAEFVPRAIREREGDV